MLGAMRGLLRTLSSTVFIFAALGFVLAHYGSGGSKTSSPPLSHHTATADFTVSYPSDWQVTSVHAVVQLPLDGSVALAPTSGSGEQLIIGVAHPTVVGDLPTGLSATLGGARPEIVSLGQVAFDRYLNVTPTGADGPESIYALPTTIGTITAVCSATHPTTAFTSSCERVLGTIRVTSGKVLSLTVDAGYALEINRILATLNATRAHAGPGLKSSSVATRVAAADTLAAADLAAANAAHHITGVPVSLANLSLETALRANAAGYHALANAAAASNAAAYTRAQARISASLSQLNAVYTQLRSYGYKVG